MTAELVARTLDPLKLKAARERLGWSIDELVFRLRQADMPVSRSAIVALEKGRTSGTVETVCKLAEVLGIRVIDRLLTDE